MPDDVAVNSQINTSRNKILQSVFLPMMLFQIHNNNVCIYNNKNDTRNKTKLPLRQEPEVHPTLVSGRCWLADSCVTDRGLCCGLVYLLQLE